MKITTCSQSDITAIYDLYAHARTLQTERKMVVWPHLEKSFMAAEIAENRHWKIVIEGEIACNWVVTYNDKDIWEEKDKNDAIYLHRIATNPNFRGRYFVKTIVEWAKAHAKQHQRAYIRLDTLGNNAQLIEHYTKSGFTFLGIFHLKNTLQLPKHYQIEPDCLLFELVV
ncbi:MAG: GNAT family N-acetyltransferase [Saprospiraceae bacterium]|nr:GNAT family N-acetyltransferase [Saprospiraceae bacterium]